MSKCFKGGEGIMNLRKYYDLDKIINRSAELVYRRVEKLLEERNDFCKCENCVLDLIAYTLNHVTPLYMTSLLGPLDDGRKEKKINTEIEVALEAGIKRIKAHPHHEGLF